MTHSDDTPLSLDPAQECQDSEEKNDDPSMIHYNAELT
jgi:hypothetical protein